MDDEKIPTPAPEVQRIEHGLGGQTTLVVPEVKMTGASWQALEPWPQIIDCDGWSGDEFTTLEIDRDEYVRRLYRCTIRPEPSRAEKEALEAAIAEQRRAVLETRTARKLARADRRRNIADAVTTIRTRPQKKDQLGWHETSAELAAWRDRLLLEGDVRTFKAVRELLALRRVLASAGMAYGVVRWLAGHGELSKYPLVPIPEGIASEVESRKRALRALAVAADMHEGLRPLVTAVEAERERLVGERTKKQRKAARELRTRNRRAFELLAELVENDDIESQEKYDKAIARARALIEEHKPPAIAALLDPLDDDSIPF